jgi:anti-sigma factor RsiW
MNCGSVEKNAIAYLDGSLPPHLRREVEGHLADCTACHERAQQFRQVWDILDREPVIRLSTGFEAAVHARIAREGVRGSLWGWLVMPSPRLAVGVAALLVFSAWLSLMPPAPQLQAVSSGETEFRMIVDLPVLEDYDVLANFEVLSELPMDPAAVPGM